MNEFLIWLSIVWHGILIMFTFIMICIPKHAGHNVRQIYSDFMQGWRQEEDNEKRSR